MYYNILESIDNIDQCVMECEWDALFALNDEIDKSCMILESYGGDDLSAFSIFCEGYIMEAKEEKKTGVLEKIKAFFKKIADMIKSFFKKLAGKDQKQEKEVRETENKIKQLTGEKKKAFDDYMECVKKGDPESIKKGLLILAGVGAAGGLTAYKVTTHHKKKKDPDYKTPVERLGDKVIDKKIPVLRDLIAKRRARIEGFRKLISRQSTIIDRIAGLGVIFDKFIPARYDKMLERIKNDQAKLEKWTSVSDSATNYDSDPDNETRFIQLISNYVDLSFLCYDVLQDMCDLIMSYKHKKVKSLPTAVEMLSTRLNSSPSDTYASIEHTYDVCIINTGDLLKKYEKLCDILSKTEISQDMFNKKNKTRDIEGEVHEDEEVVDFKTYDDAIKALNNMKTVVLETIGILKHYTTIINDIRENDVEIKKLGLEVLEFNIDTSTLEKAEFIASNEDADDN